jgi:hypothetical protein
LHRTVGEKQRLRFICMNKANSVIKKLAFF